MSSFNLKHQQTFRQLLTVITSRPRWNLRLQVVSGIADGSRSFATFNKRAGSNQSWTSDNQNQSSAVNGPQKKVRPRASNPSFYEKQFVKAIQDDNIQIQQNPTAVDDIFENRPSFLTQQLKNSPEKTKASQLEPSEASSLQTLGDYLSTEMAIPRSTWVKIQNIAPLSSLDAILTSVDQALIAEQERGILNLDAEWTPDDPLPFLKVSSEKETDYSQWVEKAKLILSPFGRPTGWYLKFKNRSVAHALLTHAKENPLKCGWKKVNIEEYTGSDSSPTTCENLIVPNDNVSDNTLRVENCPEGVTENILLHFFSRYDLVNDRPAVTRWQGTTPEGKVASTPTFLIHFADASWARAALREKQSIALRMGEGQPLRLAQYPKQIL